MGERVGRGGREVERELRGDGEVYDPGAMGSGDVFLLDMASAVWGRREC